MAWRLQTAAFDQLVNNAACVRGPANGGTNVGATHSHIPEGLFAAFPGLKVCAPATPADAKGLIKAAIRDNAPVYVMENTLLYGIKGEVPDPEDGDDLDAPVKRVCTIDAPAIYSPHIENEQLPSPKRVVEKVLEIA